MNEHICTDLCHISCDCGVDLCLNEEEQDGEKYAFVSGDGRSLVCSDCYE